MTQSYQIDIPAFSGPLELLLHLIERNELDITAISLAKVTDQYLAQIEAFKEERLDELIDFLVIGARLVLIKSRALLPAAPSLPNGEDEEDPTEALLRQLRIYKRFKLAARWLEARGQLGLRTYLRLAPPPRIEKTLDLSGISLIALAEALIGVLARTDTIAESVTLVKPRRITVEGQMNNLRHAVAQRPRVNLREVLSEAADRVELSITLLAILEAIKRQEITVEQNGLFMPIYILRATPLPEAPAESLPLDVA